MTIAFAGIGLTPPSDADRIVQQYWHGHRLFDFDFPTGTQVPTVDILPIPFPEQQEPPRIGVLRWPTGATKFSWCHLLATGNQLSQVKAAIGDSPTAKSLVFSDGTNSVMTDMWMLRPHPIAQRGSNELYVVTLVDERWWWWQAGDQASPEQSTSWNALLSSLFSSIGVTATIDTIPSGYGVPSQRWNIGYKPIPILIDAACRTVGLRMVRKLDGSVRCFNFENSEAIDETDWNTYRSLVLSGGRIEASDVAIAVPEKVATVFPYSVPAYVEVSLTGLGVVQYGSSAGCVGRVAQIIADLSNSTDTTAMGNYATQAATDYYSWQLSLTDCTLRGFQERDPTGLDSVMEWVHAPDQLVTRIIPPPQSDRNLYGDGIPLPNPVTTISVDVLTSICPAGSGSGSGGTDIIEQRTLTIVGWLGTAISDPFCSTPAECCPTTITQGDCLGSPMPSALYILPVSGCSSCTGTVGPILYNSATSSWSATTACSDNSVTSPAPVVGIGAPLIPSYTPIVGIGPQGPSPSSCVCISDVVIRYDGSQYVVDITRQLITNNATAYTQNHTGLAITINSCDPVCWLFTVPADNVCAEDTVYLISSTLDFSACALEWNCVNNVCVSTFDGTYTSESGCAVACGSGSGCAGNFCDLYTIVDPNGTSTTVTLTRDCSDSSPSTVWTGGGYSLIYTNGLWYLNIGTTRKSVCVWKGQTGWDGLGCMTFQPTGFFGGSMCGTRRVCCGGGGSGGSGGGGVITSCCPSYAIPTVLYVTFSGGTGDMAAFDGTVVTLVYNSGSGYGCGGLVLVSGWYGEYTVGGYTYGFWTNCGVYAGVRCSDGCVMATSPNSPSCDPYTADGTITFSCLSGSVDFLITETP